MIWQHSPRIPYYVKDVVVKRANVLIPYCTSVYQRRFYSVLGTNRDDNDKKDSFLLKLVNRTPEPFQSYLKLIRIHQPTGIWLTFWPSAWSLGLATSPGEIPDLKLLCLFGIGAIMVRGAGCIVNDMWDRRFDKQVERTRSRPLASGKVSIEEAVVLMSSHLGLALLVLLQLNWPSVLLGISVIPMIALYPAFKRFTYWPQLFLGLTFNWGVLIGWTAVAGSFNFLPIMPLYTAAISWTMIYDTIYALQDKEDDLKAGVKSTAIKFGDDIKKWLLGFSLVTMLGLTSAGVVCLQTWPFFAATTLSGLHIISQIVLVDMKNIKDCAAKFRSNSHLGFLIFVGIIAGTLLKEHPLENLSSQDT